MIKRGFIYLSVSAWEFSFTVPLDWADILSRRSVSQVLKGHQVLLFLQVDLNHLKQLFVFESHCFVFGS